MSTYDVNAPNANQSPSLFPAQANGNFTRLKQIINVEHNFTDSMTNTQGVHKQITFINRTDLNPGFGDANAVLYTKFDANNASQLFYFNGVLRQQLTPQGIVAPISLIFTNTLAAGASIMVYANPGFDWNGVGSAVFNGANYSFYYLNKYQGTTDNQIVYSPIAVPATASTAPILFFTGADLWVKNNANVSRVIKTSLIINRIAL